MRARHLAIACALLVTTPTTAWAQAKPAPAAAKSKPLGATLTGQPKADYEAGRALFNDGDHSGALIKFQAAFDASKDPRLLYNLAACEKSMRHYARAIELLKQYSAAGPTFVSDKEKKEADELVKALEPFTIVLTIEVNEPEVEISIDDKVVGKSPLAPIVVDIGQRRIRARKEGFREVTTTTSVGGAAKQTVPLTLEKEIHEGKLVVQAPATATVTIDGRVVKPADPKQPITETLAAGGHTLRVTAPGMRPYEREVVVNDKETRAVEVVLEAETAPDRPKLRVAVGCVDAEPRSAQDGLSIYLDGSPTPEIATGGKKHFDSALGREVVDYIEYPVTAGRYAVLVRIPGCKEKSGTVDVEAVNGGDLKGALPSASPLLVRGPAGNPNWGRIALALWFPSSVDDYGNVVSPVSTAKRALGDVDHFFSATGVLVQPSLVGRWTMTSLDIGYARGSTEADSIPANRPTEIVELLRKKGDVDWFRLGGRFGPRFPFHSVALALGVTTGFDYISGSNMPEGLAWERTANAYFGGWAMLDAYVLCDWPVHFGFDIEGRFKKSPFDEVRLDGGTKAFQIGVAYQPNSVCRAERSTDYRVGSGPSQRGAL